MNEYSESATPVAFGPSARMFPPAGCRGALTTWPQLRRATAALNGGANIGGPDHLLAALAIAPALLQGDRPPVDIYGHYTWLMTKVLGAVRTVDALLVQLPRMLESTRAMTDIAPGELARQVLVGPGGLQPAADRIGQLADAFVQRLADVEQRLERHQALGEFRSSGARVREIAGVAAGARAEQLAMLHATTAQLTVQAGAGLAAMETHAAAVSANAILANMSAAIRAMGSEWRAISINFAAAVADATPSELGDPAYLRNTLQLEAAASQWNEFGNVVQGYLQDLPRIGAC